MHIYELLSGILGKNIVVSALKEYQANQYRFLIGHKNMTDVGVMKIFTFKLKSDNKKVMPNNGLDIFLN